MRSLIILVLFVSVYTRNAITDPQRMKHKVRSLQQTGAQYMCL